jgi:hypothetical protein
MACRDVDRLLRTFSALLAPLAAGCGPGLAGESTDAGSDTSGNVGDDEGTSGDDSTGGSDSGGDDGIDPARFDTDLCDETGSWILSSVTPGEPFDYAELRSAERIDWDENVEWNGPYVRESFGERCSGAADLAACEAAFTGLPLESEWAHGGFEGQVFWSLALTRADLAQAIADRPALDAFLGALDGPADAALLAVLEGHRLACADGPDVGVHDEGWVLHTTSGGGCGEGDDILEHVVLVHPDGTIEVLETVLVELGDPGCAAGRLPQGLCRVPRARSRAERPVGSFFAGLAHLEAAAVPAFGQLARELAMHRAPPRMIDAALRSRRDEIRHARITARLAQRHGGRPAMPRVAPCSPRSLVEVLADNAAEGCIRESYGALVAHVQARRATDPVVRRALAAIARDETRHAALSWQIAGWAEARMRRGERAEVARRARQSIERLEHELVHELHDRVHAVAGMPRPDEARALFAGLRDALWT